MKEATGELNLAVFVMISIGILVAFFFTVLWPVLRGNFESVAQCRSAVCDCSLKDSENMCPCWTKSAYESGDVGESSSFLCPYGG